MDITHTSVSSMRAKITVRTKNGNNILPFDNNYFMMSYLYRIIGYINPDFAADLHNARDFKHYTFSYVNPKEIRPVKTGLKIIDNHLSFRVSSPNEEFIRYLVEGMLEHPEIKIGKVEGTVENIELVKPPAIKHKLYMNTLSPVIVKKPVKRDGKLRSHELYPKDGQFYTYLLANLRKRYSHFTKTPAENKNVHFEFLSFKPKRHNINGEHWRGSFGKLVMEGDPDLMRFAYEAGLGEKGSCGFGCVEVKG